MGRKERKKMERPAAAGQLRQGQQHPFGLLGGAEPLGGGEEQLYRAVREAVPVLDAAVGKLVRLTGGFTAACEDKRAQAGLQRFLRQVPVGRGQYGMERFLAAYLDSMLTYGRAVGEMVVAGNELAAVCWGDVTRIHVRQGKSLLDMTLGSYKGGQFMPFRDQELLLFSTRDPEPARPYGVSLFRGLPFFAEVLMKIYNTVGVNWERAGNVRYSVVYRPKDGGDDPQAAEQMAREWASAMQDSRSGAVRDFVAVGDVEIKVIGADGQILEPEAPVRLLMEQLVAKTGLPPFLLGLSWSSTERMAAQQADLLTSELWSIRRSVQPVLEKVCRMWLRLNGFAEEVEIVWDDISLQDLTEQSRAALYQAQAEKIRKEMEETA